MKKVINAICVIALMTTSINQVSAQTVSGDLFRGWSRPITNNQMIVPYGLEVSYHKTTHLIFPSSIRYVDLGSKNIIAGKAEQADNVLRVKAGIEDFETETNLTVICEDGNFYNFNVKYTDEPEKLNIEVKDFLLEQKTANTNKQTVLFKELSNESPQLVNLIMQTIYKKNRTRLRHIGSKKLGIEFVLKSLYVHNGLLYFHTELENDSKVPFEVDFMTFRVVDKKMLKKTAIQEKQIQPVRMYHPIAFVGGDKKERSVFCLEKMTLPDDKKLVISIFEKNGGRHQSFDVKIEDIINAENIKKLRLKW